jgi:hypothetical protein
MTYPLTLTTKQPENWARLTLGDCFTVQSSSSTSANATGGGRKGCPCVLGDVLIMISRERMHARIAGAEDTHAPAQGGLLRGNGAMRPEFLLMILALPQVQRDLINFCHPSSFQLMHFSHIRQVVVGVPDLATQDQLIQAEQVSSGWLRSHIANLRKSSDTLEKMATGISHEIIIGKADSKIALEWVGKALKPQLDTIRRDILVEKLDADAVVGIGGEGEYVRADEHDKRVAALKARIAELEGGGENSHETKKPGGP